LWVAAAIELNACALSNQYLLKVDADDPSASQLCLVEKPGTLDCDPPGGAHLEGPGSLTVRVVNAEEDATYAAKIENETAGLASHQPGAVLKEVMGRLGALSDGISGSLLSKLDASEREPEQRTIRREVLSKTLQGLGMAAHAGVRKLQSEVVGPEPAPTPGIPTENLFRRYLRTTELAKEPTDGVATKIYGFPSNGPPPARVRDWDAADLQYLRDKLGANLTDAMLSQRLRDYCGPDSFGNVTFTVPPVLWKEYVKAPLDEGAVLSGFGLTRELAKSALTGKSLAIVDLVREKINGATKAGVNGNAEQKQLVYFVQSANLYHRLDHCAHNIEFLKSEIADTTSVSNLGTLLGEVISLREEVKGAAQLFELVIAPFLADVARSVMQEKPRDGVVNFAAVGVEPGSLSVAVERTGDGEAASPISSFEFKVVATPRVAVSVGFLLSAGPGSFQRVEERTQPAHEEMGMPVASRRTLSLTENDTSYGAAISLHVTLYEPAPTHHVGLMLGYPLVDQTGTRASLLVGPSYRWTRGFQAGIGAHLFLAERLAHGVPDTVDLSLPGNETITRNAVVVERPGAAFFLMLGISQELLGQL
jgi:hypothetical protein